jgi:hypothetical protein
VCTGQGERDGSQEAEPTEIYLRFHIFPGPTISPRTHTRFGEGIHTQEPAQA